MTRAGGGPCPPRPSPQNGNSGGWNPVTCQHSQGFDIDYGEDGAITVQLYPYDDTPNNGGVYKAWITPVEAYAGNPDYVPVDKNGALDGEDPQAGDYTAVEETPSCTLQTVSHLDGKVVSSYPVADPPVVVNVAGTTGENHEIVCGNLGLGAITACKVFDRNGNGLADPGAPGVAGGKMELPGTDVLGNSVSKTEFTGADSCGNFGNLLTGT